MTSWKSTIGGALSATGTMLVGIGVIPQLKEGPSGYLQTVALIGFALQAAGTFFGHLFAADKTEVQQMIEKSKSDTEVLLKDRTPLP